MEVCTDTWSKLGACCLATADHQLHDYDITNFKRLNRNLVLFLLVLNAEETLGVRALVLPPSKLSFITASSMASRGGV